MFGARSRSLSTAERPKLSGRDKSSKATYAVATVARIQVLSGWFRVSESENRTVTQGFAGWRRFRPGLVERPRWDQVGYAATCGANGLTRQTKCRAPIRQTQVAIGQLRLLQCQFVGSSLGTIDHGARNDSNHGDQQPVIQSQLLDVDRIRSSNGESALAQASARRMERVERIASERLK